jgi:hypothetical protein
MLVFGPMPILQTDRMTMPQNPQQMPLKKMQKRRRQPLNELNNMKKINGDKIKKPRKVYKHLSA